MIIISQDNNTMLLSQHIIGGEIDYRDSYDSNIAGYAIIAYTLSLDVPVIGTYPTPEEAQQELKRLLERINRSTSNSATYQLPPAGYNTIPERNI